MSTHSSAAGAKCRHQMASIQDVMAKLARRVAEPASVGSMIRSTPMGRRWRRVAARWAGVGGAQDRERQMSRAPGQPARERGRQAAKRIVHAAHEHHAMAQQQPPKLLIGRPGAHHHTADGGEHRAGPGRATEIEERDAFKTLGRAGIRPVLERARIAALEQQQVTSAQILGEQGIELAGDGELIGAQHASFEAAHQPLLDASSAATR